MTSSHSCNGNVPAFTRMASLDVSGDADDGERVDAAETENQREETVHLRDNSRSMEK